MGHKTCELSVMHRFFWPRSGFVVDLVQKMRAVGAITRSDRHPGLLFPKCDIVATFAGLGASKREPGFNFRGLGELKW